MEAQTAIELTKDIIYRMDADELIDAVVLLFDLEPLLRAPMMAYVRRQAMKLDIADIVMDLIKQYTDVEAKESKKAARAASKANAPVDLERDAQGRVQVTIPNFLAVMRGDPYFANVRYNSFRGAPEVVDSGTTRIWVDADDAAAKGHIEGVYKMHNTSKYYDAASILFRDREYHPVRELIESTEWDGVTRIETFLHKWMQCDDTPYTQEVSRLIFAGGINRVYDPGCKFDEMPVLIGTKQGEGKTTLVNWLAMEDRFFREVTAFDGQASMDALDGAWICEVGEMLALTKTKEKEAVKSYLTRKTDTYRRSYDRRVADYPRQCMFIGTTNKREFLTDMTGNRRYYPVVVRGSGRRLYTCRSEVQSDIAQCWAEALVRFRAGNMPPVADQELLPTIKEMQRLAQEDDYRVGMIEDYIKDKEEICGIELWREALNHPYDTPQPKDLSDISLIMQKFDGWERSKGQKRLPKYGKQRLWVRREVKISVSGGGTANEGGTLEETFLDMTGAEIGIFDY